MNRALMSLTAALVLYLAVVYLWEFEGQVYEEGTKAPIAGAFVVAMWKGSVVTFAHSASACYHIELTTTDAQGKYRIPAVSGNFNPLRIERRRTVSVYAPGFRIAPSTVPGSGQIAMVPLTGSKEEQFAQVRWPLVGTCMDSHDRRLLPMYRRALQEQTALASSREMKDIVVRGLLETVDQIELGQSKAIENTEKRFADRSGLPRELQ